RAGELPPEHPEQARDATVVFAARRACVFGAHWIETLVAARLVEPGDDERERPVPHTPTHARATTAPFPPDTDTALPPSSLQPSSSGNARSCFLGLRQAGRVPFFLL